MYREIIAVNTRIRKARFTATQDGEYTVECTAKS